MTLFFLLIGLELEREIYKGELSNFREALLPIFGAIGITLLTLLAVILGISKLPDDFNWKSVLGVGFLGGIGFTMSIFITLLAFDDPTVINNSKLVILLSSLTAGLIGFLILRLTLKKGEDPEQP